MTPEEQAANVEAIRKEAAKLVRLAMAYGVVVSIEQRPLKPLAMTHYETTIDVRPDRRAK